MAMSDSETPTEGGILRAALLPPSSLPAIISMKDFTALFPASIREHPQIGRLYRALQHQRALDLDFVRDNINAEVKLGEKQHREILRSAAKGAGGTEGLDIDEALQEGGVPEEQDVAMDGLLYSQHPSSAYEPHTLATIIPAMDTAIASLEAEISDLEAQSDQAQAQLESQIGDLSDLRYGKLHRSSLNKTVLQALDSLASECNLKGAADVKLQDG